MTTVTSADGTPIAYEQAGDGPPVVVVGGALCDRELLRPFAQELARYSTVLNYDRRGRGDSGDAAGSTVDREVEDLAAVIAAAGGPAAVYGHSSGAALVLHAAARGLPIDALVLHEAPFTPDSEEHRRASLDYVERLDALLEEGRRGEAVELFLRLTGAPPEAVGEMRTGPWWPRAQAMAPTLAYDSAAVGHRTGGTVPAELLAEVAIPAPALVLCGGASPAWMIEAGRRIADALPDGRLRVLEGEGHVVSPERLAPLVGEFFKAAEAT